MESTKLTIRIPIDLIQGAKRYAAEHNTTLTRLVSAYLQQLSSQTDPLANAPTVRRLSGILPKDISTRQYKDHLEKKYVRED